MKILQWIFWYLVYAVRPQPKELETYITKGIRLSPPWWKFRPSVWHNPDGKMWHVYFENESSYTISRRTLSIELHIGQESGKVVGLNIWDETLIAAAEAAKEEK